ncbi:MAG: mechanosensitive ion channel family protein [Deltaproteobacteria bacterium]|nr:mechanosensitive ion channel family protein [Deltaproteobacteria bacterium]
MVGQSTDHLATKLVELGVNVMLACVRILVILAIAYVAMRCLRFGLTQLETLLIRAAQATDRDPNSAAKRIRTLTSVLWTVAVGLIWFVAVLISLGQLGIDLGPILAGAGIVGLAVGFGAQHLVRDLVSGFFLILENHIRVGDTVTINGTSGVVEAISFRTVTLRDLAGVLHVFPNGAINTLANQSKGWSAYVIDVTVSYKENSDRVVDIMRATAEELRAEPNFAALMIEPIEIFGIDAFTDAGVVIKARFKTQSSQQHTVGREYRARLKRAFEAAGIDFAPVRAVAR